MYSRCSTTASGSSAPVNLSTNATASRSVANVIVVVPLIVIRRAARRMTPHAILQDSVPDEATAGLRRGGVFAHPARIDGVEEVHFLHVRPGLAFTGGRHRAQSAADRGMQRRVSWHDSKPGSRRSLRQPRAGALIRSPPCGPGAGVSVHALIAALTAPARHDCVSASVMGRHTRSGIRMSTVM
jgi:hypothetical protein